MIFFDGLMGLMVGFGVCWVCFVVGFGEDDDGDGGFGMIRDGDGRPSLSRHRCRWEQMGLGLVRTNGFDFGF